MIDKGQADHGLTDRNNPGDSGNVMAPTHLEGDGLAREVNGLLLFGDGRNRVVTATRINNS